MSGHLSKKFVQKRKSILWYCWTCGMEEKDRNPCIACSRWWEKGLALNANKINFNFHEAIKHLISEFSVDFSFHLVAAPVCKLFPDIPPLEESLGSQNPDSFGTGVRRGRVEWSQGFWLPGLWDCVWSTAGDAGHRGQAGRIRNWGWSNYPQLWAVSPDNLVNLFLNN